MKNATNNYLTSMKTQKRILNYIETTNQEEVNKFISNRELEMGKKLIIGLRIFLKPSGCDYHYIRWYDGQWSAKSGESGPIVVNSDSDSAMNVEPETMWAATLFRKDKTGKRENGSVYMRRPLDHNIPGYDGQVHKEAIYGPPPTVYYLINLV